ncbi:MAG TPA: HEAT repeat domain-containing protein [Nitrospirota bacterium]|nr:HEAT repeat domain-containing protein [Nitrospirota bacterium]
MPNLEFLGKKLQSSDAEDRREAAVDLGRAGRDAAPLLFRAMGDADWRVRKTAVEALVANASDSIIMGLIRLLSSDDNAGSRNSAIEALVHIGAAAVDALLMSLDTPDADVRKFIVDILGDIRDSRAVPILIETLKNDPNENIRVSSAEALGKIKDCRAVDPLLACLTQYGQSWLDYAAAEAIGEIGDERALGPLIAALGRNNLREPVLESIGKIGNVNTLMPLIAGLADKLRVVREVAMVALTAIYLKSTQDDRERIIRIVRANVNDRAVDFLEEMLITSTKDLQKSAVAVLGWSGRESSIQKLLALLKEEDMEEPTAQALKNMDGGRVPLLLGYLADDNALVRRTVARVLGEIGSRDADDPLIGLLLDENGHVRSAAAEALGHLQSRKAVKPLLGLLADEYESVQESAIRALAEIGDDSILDDLLKDFTSRDALMRRNIALLLGRFTTDKASDALAFALKDEEPNVRKAVVHALGNLSGDKALRSLVHAITDDNSEVRMLAAEALGKTHAPETPDVLIPLLEDNDLWVRAAAARSLGRVAGEKAGEVLAAYLNTATDIFLLSLVDVVGKLRTERALAPLLGLSCHADPEVRKTVLTALSGYHWESVHQTVLSRLSDPHWSVRKTAIEIIKQKKDAAAEPLLERIADGDPDATVRQAAKDALGR